MTFEQAIVKSIRQYFKGVQKSTGLDLRKTKGKSKYTRDYFNSVAEENGIEPYELD